MGQGKKVDSGRYYLVKRGVSCSFRWLLCALLILPEQIADSFFKESTQRFICINSKVLQFLDTIFINSGGKYLLFAHDVIFLTFFDGIRQEFL